MHIPTTDSELRVVLTQPVDINIRHNVDRRAGPSVPEDPLQVGLDGHVRSLVRVENSGPNVS